MPNKNNPRGAFLNLPPEYSDPAASRYVVLPAPFEGTVCYKTGTSAGPHEIIDASRQVEKFDEELRDEFYAAGVTTLPMLQPAAGVQEQLRRTQAAALPVMNEGRFLLTLGGEHSLTVGLVAAAVEAHGELSVLQIDAHADLRDVYFGERYSHACVMRHVLATAGSICQVGIRNYSREEFEACREQIDRIIAPTDMDAEGRWIDRALGMLREKVYVTIDIDGFDPSIAPGTGTPEPGGMTWQQGIALLRRVCTERTVVAADIVEVRPIPPNHITEFLAARLAYKIIAYTQL